MVVVNFGMAGMFRMVVVTAARFTIVMVVPAAAGFAMVMVVAAAAGFAMVMVVTTAAMSAGMVGMVSLSRVDFHFSLHRPGKPGQFRNQSIRILGR